MATILSRTVYGAAVQTRKMFNKDIPILENTTLNEVLTNGSYIPFQPEPVTRGMEVAEPYNYASDSAGVHLGYFVIGNLGHRAAIGNATGPAGNVPLNTPVEHLATDAGLFNMIPFAVVPVDNDLSAIEQADYGMRKTMFIDDTLYAAYYCRRLDVDSIEFTELLVTVENGIEIPVPFIPAGSNLYPQQPTMSGQTRGDYVKSTAMVQITFNELQQQRLVEAARLIYGSPDYAIISEVGFCTGVDKAITKRYPNNGAQTPANVVAGRKEAIAVQVAVHYTLSPIDVASARRGLDGAWDVGIGEPLYGVRSA